MSYNILANCYADTALAREELFNYCPAEFLDFKYRRLLLVHEIKSKVILIINSSFELGSFMGPLLGGFLVQQFSFLDSTFYIGTFIIIYSILFIFSFIQLEEKRKDII